MHAFETVNLSHPSQTREFPCGRFDVFRIGDALFGRAKYDPGWCWSEHVAPTAGTDLCEVAHLGLVLSGRACVLMRDGEERLLSPGDFFAIPAGHDSWVVGDEPYVSLHLAGAETYASDDG